MVIEVFGVQRDRAAWSRVSAELREQLDGEEVIVIANRVGVLRHLRGHVPGIISAASATRSRGSFAFTATRAIATFPTGADPHLRAVDSRWDVPYGPAHMTIGSHGIQIDIALRGIHPAFSGSMTLNYNHVIAEDLLDMLPARQLWCSIDPSFVYRSAGVGPWS